MVTGGVPAPEVLASMRYRPGPAEVSISYARAQTTLVGFAGIVDTQSVTASAAYMLRRAGAGSHHAGPVPDGKRWPGEPTPAAWPSRLSGTMTGRLSLRASYEATVQRGSLTAAPSADSISRHVVQLSVVAAPASRRAAGR